MKKLFLSGLTFVMMMFGAKAQTKYITHAGKAVIYSHTVAEDITAENNTVTGMINTGTGDIAISVPVQSFQFEKELMQEHFNNSNFMDSRAFPKILMKGKIVNLSGLDLSRNGKYDAVVEGDLTIKGVSRPLSEKAVIEVNNGQLTVTSKFTVQNIGDYGVGKPMGSKKNNVADDIQVTYTAAYERSE